MPEPGRRPGGPAKHRHRRETAVLGFPGTQHSTGKHEAGPHEGREQEARLGALSRRGPVVPDLSVRTGPCGRGQLPKLSRDDGGGGTAMAAQSKHAAIVLTTNTSTSLQRTAATAHTMATATEGKAVRVHA